MKKTLLAFVTAGALVACGGGGASSGGSTTARQGSHPDQGTAAPHIECGSSAGHHGSGCPDSSGGATSTDGTTASDGTAPATDADAGTAAPQ